MRKLYLIAATATMLAACTSNDNLEAPAPPQPELKQIAVNFDAYQQRSVTRAGAVGDITLASLKTNSFGVFGYYTDANEYDPQATPNFMYNEKIMWDDTNNYWYYSPVKYWPNEYGSTAISDEQDKVSFFAYAPYVPVTASTGKITDGTSTGITGLSRNSATGDPLVKYVASFDAAESVDLCWGTVGAGNESWATMAGGQTLIAGKPWLNVERAADATALSETTGQKVKFQFLHALAKFKVMIDAYVDGIDATNALAADETKIWVRSVSFTGMATKGSLNLNNTVESKAEWLDYNGTADLESGETVTIYDGRKDGKEGAAGSTAANEKTLGLNPVVISDDGNTKAGVTNTEVSLFASDNPFYVIPTGEEIEVEIVYDVETKDANLATYLSDGSTPGSSIENKIKKKIVWASGGNVFENGKSYVLHLHLGMNSVKFDADVQPWDADNNNSHTDLPANMPIYTAGATGAGGTVTLPAGITSYEFAVNGLDASEAVAWTFTTVTEASKDATASAAGYAKAKATIAANATTSNVANAGTVMAVGGTSGKEYTLTISQSAAPLQFTAIVWDGGTKTATCTIGNADVTALNDAGIEVTMKKDGAAFTDFTLGADKVVTLTTDPVVAGTYSITIKANDAAPVTQTFTVE